ncbi:MAG: hypothetical protein L3J83_01625 [Proteobacteria bacterium]|nr:hypothetical protein [Pseudomonadota bacterium]
MNKIILVFIFILIKPNLLFAWSSGSGTCDIDANYASITAMSSWFRNPNKGSYVVETNSPYYTPNQIVEITLSGPTFTGILFKVVDENNNAVGTFDTNANSVIMCNGSMAMVLTHNGSFVNSTSYTLFWIAPDNIVGKVYILAYVLKGTRGSTATQEFFRFVRDDDSAVSISPNVVFSNGFE